MEGTQLPMWRGRTQRMIPGASSCMIRLIRQEGSSRPASALMASRPCRLGRPVLRSPAGQSCASPGGECRAHDAAGWQMN